MQQQTDIEPTSELSAHVLQLFGKEGVTQEQACLPDRAPASHSLQIRVPDSLTLVSENREERKSHEAGDLSINALCNFQLELEILELYLLQSGGWGGGERQLLFYEL